MKLRSAIVRGALVTHLLAVGAGSSAGAGINLEVEILATFNGHPLEFDALRNKTKAGPVISVTRLDCLVSNFELKRCDGSWLGQTNWQAFLSWREARNRFGLPQVPAGDYEAVRFLVGVTPAVNNSNPAQYPPDHPLNPSVNGLHWGWQGGYVFLALEGDWCAEREQVSNPSAVRGYSFHIANDPQLMTVELPLKATLNYDQVLRLALDIGDIFEGRHRIELAEKHSSTHARTNDVLAGRLRENIEGAFRVEGLFPWRSHAFKGCVSTALLSSNAVPYPFTMSRFFPRPALPLDNPLTEQGVALGRFLFHEERLSINGSQSCASCHDLSAAGTDPGRAVSRGAEGRTGTRNAMSLFNLAWKNSFFWDGRARTLREQVLMPIQDPNEMHETLAGVVAKLDGERGGNDAVGPHISYPWLFNAAFGSPDISADRVARALEQFLLVQVSHHAKFDRVLNGELTFTKQEQRGFELFHTEYDPRQGLYGADCFHCHGGPLFQNANFANNGLDPEPKDPGRFQVTGREGDKGKFAVPSLRNVAVTGPYMHDGRFKRLEEVVEHYSTGIQRSATLDPNLAQHPQRGLNLSLSDKRALVAFLKTLTDERFMSERTSRLP